MYRPNDYIHQLADYIKRNLVKGYTLDSLKYSLITQGYSKISVEKAIDITNKELADNAPIMKEKPEITYKIIKENSEPIIIQKKESFWKRLFGR